jgi:hydroxymethylpyrimidine pyrophosphatase-like HAD family hydrolase
MFPTLPFVKLELKGDTLPGLLRHEDFLKQHFSLQDIGIGIYELALPNINKENAVRLLLDAIGHSRENTYAIGDSENDLGMLEAVQTPIAMGNALPHVKKKAVWVTDTVRKDGVYTALQHFGLIEKCETKKF